MCELPAITERAAEADGHIFICTDANWSGSCTDYGFTAGVCSNFPQGFQDDISSLGPDAGWFCNVYIDYNCNNDQSSLRVDNPGIASLGWGNDAFSSLQCFRT
ncbi:hypothetical protein PHLCEN_2v8399 [Hermanssonia centrifuga]|uniref:Uncharacterized protein n=1 Tax=Hermanssonia centrifuga TaxID=98765 RepID=A0A2R6NTQ1_9APHY|nr:hypothetical protein PHLCEN_2v8399 [Hermanssonia centrifuga]